MSDLIYSMNIVMPLFLVGLCGYIVKRVGIVDVDFMSKGTTLCFRLLLPVMLFNEIYNSRIKEQFDVRVFTFGIVGVLVVCMLSIPLSGLFVKNSDKRSAVAHAIFRSNFILMGISMIENMYGPESSVHVAALMPVVISLFNIFAVIVFTTLAPHDGEKVKIDIPDLLKKVVTNPFIVAIAIALLFLTVNFRLPMAVDRAVDYIARSSTPIALITIGGQFNIVSARENLKYSLPTSFIRLVAVPSIILSIAVFMGFRDVELATFLILFGSPTAVSSAAMAKSMDGDFQLSADITMITTFLSAITMFFFIFTLRRMGLL